jgi:tripartite-type tricarboxylate transporter receptor subunit TctC
MGKWNDSRPMKGDGVGAASGWRSFWLLAVLALCADSGSAQEYPARAIRVVVPQAAGSSTDIVARILAEQLSARVRQQVFVDPRPGAGGSIGAAVVAKAPPDGYTLLMANSGPLAINAGLYRELPYDPVVDFAPVSLVAVGPYVLLAHPSLPAVSVKELISLAKSRPQELTFASGGNGTGTHLSGELLKQITGRKMVHVPYKGSAPGLVDLVAGQVSVMFIGLPPALPQLKANRVRALAVTGTRRSQALPGVPTMMEAGVPGYVVYLWLGLVAPTGTPAAIVQGLNAHVRAMDQSPRTTARLSGLGLSGAVNSPGEFSAFIRSEIAMWSKVIRESGAKVH